MNYTVADWDEVKNSASVPSYRGNSIFNSLHFGSRHVPGAHHNYADSASGQALPIQLCPEEPPKFRARNHWVRAATLLPGTTHLQILLVTKR